MQIDHLITDIEKSVTFLQIQYREILKEQIFAPQENYDLVEDIT